MSQEGLIVVALLASVRMSWTKTIYYMLSKQGFVDSQMKLNENPFFGTAGNFVPISL